MDCNPQGIATAMVNLHIRHIKQHLRASPAVDRTACVRELHNYFQQNPGVRAMFNRSNYTLETLLKAVYG